jgi:hypothetical protein
MKRDEAPPLFRANSGAASAVLALFRCCFTAVPLLLSHNSKMALIPLKIKPEFKQIFQHNSGEFFARE